MFKLNKTMLLQPRKLTWPFGWCGHIPFVGWLIEEHQPRIIVELGTHSGNSYFAICQSVAENDIDAKCYAVDTWLGDEHAFYYDENVYNQVVEHNNDCYSAFSNLMRMTFDEAIGYFSDNSLDLLHIDGLHTYEAVKHDFENWLPKMSERGIILFHDTNVRERNFGVWRLWEELSAQYPHFEFKHSHGLGVLFVGSESHRILTEKLSYPLHSEMVHSLFAKLGESITHGIKSKIDLEKSIALQNELTENVKRLEEDVQTISEENENIKFELQEQQQQFGAILLSRSWKITKPLRFIFRIFRGQYGIAIQPVKSQLREQLRTLYYKVPASYRPYILNAAFKMRPGTFRNHPQFLTKFNRNTVNITDNHNEIMDINQIEDNFTGSPGRVAVHCHIFYHDLVNEFYDQLNKIPFKFDAYVSVTTEEAKEVCQTKLSTIANINLLDIVIVPNRGRDIAPMFVQFGEKLKSYDYIAHIHSKKSLYNNGSTLGWREYLFNGLFGSTSNLKRIFSLFRDNENLGIVYPQTYYQLPYIACCWLANRAEGQRLCHLMNIMMPEGYFSFPAGSMFWARVNAIRPLFDLNLTWQDFPEEHGQTDGTIAHALERLLGVVPTATGFSAFIIKDMTNQSWSPYRLDTQYLSKTMESYLNIINDNQIKIVAFDIFDTLLVRPLLNPDNTKEIVSQLISPNKANAYRQYRSVAECQARAKKGLDVGIEDIYAEFTHLSGLTIEQVTAIKKREIQVEIASVSAREDAVKLFNSAKKAGKKIILISDMFLSKETIAEMLTQNGITGWDNIYLSSDCGVRKDSGKLYELMLNQEGINGQQILMIGDNERSDIQIPYDMYNIRILHLLKASELAKTLPVYQNYVTHEAVSADINSELTIGLVIKENLNKISEFNESDINIFNHNPEKLGFNFVGPILASFCHWLIQQAKSDNVDCLYFLAREGKLIKEAYDIWASSIPNAPKSYYLQLSRRAVNVPNITCFNDVKAIAELDFFPNTINSFLYERFGIELSENRWQAIFNQGLWIKDNLLEIRQKNIQSVEPLLQYLLPDILNEAKKEKSALMRYLNEVEFIKNRNSALVDVGYSGTIQKALNRLVEQPVHGYYFATSDNIHNGLDPQIITKGCFVNESKPCFPDSHIFTKSFSLEKLLSASDTQIIKYSVSENNELQRQFKELRPQELAALPVRNEMHKGVIKYMQQSARVRKSLYQNYVPSLPIANELYTDFIKQTRNEKNDVLEKLILDDEYCGRGLV